MNVFNQSPHPPPPEDPRPTREEGRRATRRTVLEAARAEFEEVGFDAAGVRSIARAAGVSSGTVLHHFGSKRELLYAAFFDDLEEALDRAQAAAHGMAEEALETRLHALASSIFADHGRRPRLSRILLRESILAEPPWDARFQGQVAALHGVVTELAAAAVERGELPQGSDLPLLGLAWISFYTFALLAWAQEARPICEDPAGVIARQMAQHLGGLRAAPSAESEASS
jgi:AcrR family transcriptional regulator